MPSSLYCPFCGIVLFHDYDRYREAPSTTKRPWYGEARAIVMGSSLGMRHHLTGIGTLRINILAAPLDSTRSYRECETLEEVNLFSRKAEGLWGYDFHESCWTLFRTRLSNVCEQDIITSLSNQLFTISCYDLSVFEFGTTMKVLQTRTKSMAALNRLTPTHLSMLTLSPYHPSTSWKALHQNGLLTIQQAKRPIPQAGTTIHPFPREAIGRAVVSNTLVPDL